MLGDNRDNSMDSRVLSQMGYVPLENIIGHAGMIYFSVSFGMSRYALSMERRLGSGKSG